MSTSKCTKSFFRLKKNLKNSLYYGIFSILGKKPYTFSILQAWSLIKHRTLEMIPLTKNTKL